MPDADLWQPKREYYFVDMGCGEEALRAISVARQNPSKNVLGIDAAFDRTEVGPNLELVKSTVDDVLAKLSDNSIQIANSDYFLNNIDAYSALGLLGTLSKKLKADGALYVSCRRMAELDLRNMVSAFGFECDNSVPISNEELELTPRGMLDKRKIQAILDYNAGKIAKFPIDLMPDMQEILNQGQIPKDASRYEPMRFAARPRRY